MNTNLKLKPNRTTTTLSAALTLVALGAAQTGHAQNLFVGQAGNTILEFTPNGTGTTFATELNEPTALAFNSSGNLFETDSNTGPIYEFTPSGTKITFATGQSAMLSPSAKLTLPIRVDGLPEEFTIEWLSEGPHVNYSMLFYLVMDGGDTYGQGELWLHVWNWGAPPE